MNLIQFSVLALAFSICNALHAQGLLKPADADSPENLEKAKLLGVLVYSRVSVQWDEKPAREAFQELGEALRIQIVGRYDDDARNHGLSPEMPLTLDAREQC